MLEADFSLDTAPPPESPATALAEPPTGELRADCLARAGVYRLLAGVFGEEPTPAFLAALRDARVVQSLTAAGVRFDSDFLDTDIAALAEVLACEYTTLFAASGGFPPVESVRLTGRYKQEPHFQTLQFYQAAGFALGRGRFAVFPDQLGVELTFVAELLDRCAAALARDDRRAYRRLDKDIKRFWTLHLGRWVRGYSQLIVRAAEHSFYREMARFLAGFAAEEIVAMNLRHLDNLDQGLAVVPKSAIRVEFDPAEQVCGGCASGSAPGEAGADRAADAAGRGASQAVVARLHDLRC